MRTTAEGVVLTVFAVLLGGTCQPQSSPPVKYSFICPYGFRYISKKCYFFSNDEADWFAARARCAKVNGTLAVLSTPRYEKSVRNYLNRNSTGIGGNAYWIGGIFDWEQKQWMWGDSGKPLKSASLKYSQDAESLQWHCTIVDPKKGNKWGANNCLTSHRYICDADAKAYVEFKLLDQKYRSRISISKCTSQDELTEKQKKKCRKLLGAEYETGNPGSHANDPASLIQMDNPVPPKPPKRRNGLYICPPDMISLDSKCYRFSKDTATWKDAYYSCMKNNTRLAIVGSKTQDHNLRRFLNGFVQDNNERWISGRYDWVAGQWKWAKTGKPLKYKGFGKNILKNRSHESLMWHSIVMDPQLNNAWNARSEFEKRFYICEVKAHKVRRIVGNKRPGATITISKNKNV